MRSSGVAHGLSSFSWNSRSHSSRLRSSYTLQSPKDAFSLTAPLLAAAPPGALPTSSRSASCSSEGSSSSSAFFQQLAARRRMGFAPPAAATSASCGVVAAAEGMGSMGSPVEQTGSTSAPAIAMAAGSSSSSSSAGGFAHAVAAWKQSLWYTHPLFTRQAKDGHNTAPPSSTTTKEQAAGQAHPTDDTELWFTCKEPFRAHLLPTPIPFLATSSSSYLSQQQHQEQQEQRELETAGPANGGQEAHPHSHHHRRRPLYWDHLLGRAFAAYTYERAAHRNTQSKLDSILGSSSNPDLATTAAHTPSTEHGMSRHGADADVPAAEAVESSDAYLPPPAPAVPAGPYPFPSPENLHSKLCPRLHADAVAPPDFADRSIYNPMTNRMTRVASPGLHGLAGIGICIDGSSMKLVMSQPELFDAFAAQVRTNFVGLPIWWSQTMSRRLPAGILSAAEPHASAAEAIAAAYRMLDLRKSSIGVVYSGNVPPTEGAGVETAPSSPVPSPSAMDDAHAAIAPVLDADGNAITSVAVAAIKPIQLSPSELANHLPQQHRSLDSLTEEQRHVLKLVTGGHHVYLGGGAGTGKTATLLTVREFLQSVLRLSVAMTATTGVAAHQIHGVTFHRMFGVKMSGDIANIGAMQHCDVVIIDEISMFPKTLFEQFDLSMRRARKKPHLPFGGCQVILCGDFMQLSAIADEPILSSCTFRNHFVMVKLQTVIRQSALSDFSIQLQLLRRGIVTESLTTSLKHTPPGKIVQDAINLLPTNVQVREANIEELAKLPGDEFLFMPHITPLFLLGDWTKTVIIRIGNIAAFSFSETLSAVTVYLASSIFQTQMLFGHNISFYPVFSDAYALRVRISPWMNPDEVASTRDKIEKIGDFIKKLKCAQVSEMSVSEVIEEGSGLHTEADESRLEHLCNASPFNQPLQLKHGAKVMLRANLSATLVNGTVGTVVGFVESKCENISRHLLQTGGVGQEAALEHYNHFCRYELDLAVPMLPVCQFGNRIETIPPHGFVVGGQIDSHFYATTVVALPLTLAYAFTVHKVQGLTLHGRVHLELSRMWQCNHLLYVAMSRVKDPSQLSLSAFDERLVKVAEECLVFDQSLPVIEEARVLPSFMASTWRRARPEALSRNLADLSNLQDPAAGGGNGSLRGSARKLRRGFMSQNATMRRRVAQEMGASEGDGIAVGPSSSDEKEEAGAGGDAHPEGGMCSSVVAKWLYML